MELPFTIAKLWLGNSKIKQEELKECIILNNIKILFILLKYKILFL